MPTIFLSGRGLPSSCVQAHNTVNRRLGKPIFNCALVEARWAGMECVLEVGGDGRDACSLEVGRQQRR